jgi:hypothetical protein
MFSMFFLFKKNLISVGALTNTGNALVFSDTTVWVLNNLQDRKIIAVGCRDKTNGLYRMEKGSLDVNAVTSLSTEELWHQRFGHLYFRGLSHLHKQKRVTGLPSIADVHHRCCHAHTHRAKITSC